ncbi:MAG TPA: RNA polymerase sigma factor [Anaeromyxobacteraceae bacterium]|nr:RNA polymerase sigma factor [Anaeromyxobacteraceae bacterium]
MADDDAPLLDAARAGDRAALERLLERHQGRVFRFGLKMCGSEDDAKDVLQETLIAAARSLRDFRGGSSLSTWLYTIARSFCIKQRRTGKHAPQHVASLEDGSGEAQGVPDARRAPDEEAAGAEVEAALRGAIGALDPKYREVLVLRDVEGLPAAEVAEVLGLSVEAVKSRLHRARLAVRERVAPALGVVDGEEPAPADVCPDVAELFSRHVEGDISGTVCSELEAHLQGCQRCRARCDSLRATLTLCAAAGDEVPLRVERSVRAALRRWIETHG